uniref:Uncharacterized protein n=1 Tax=Arundo donax TaxID=35708 RepID=A0A0A9EVN7_ARUDO
MIGVNWADSQYSLLMHGYKESESLYYLKPGHKPPDGVVLMLGEVTLGQLIIKHDAIEKLYYLNIVLEPTLVKTIEQVTHFGSDIGSDSDDDTM